jgi:molybdopterin-guanine dinucleotide biosynthesis protein A
MGRDKATLPWGARTLAEHVVRRLRPHFAEVLMVGRHRRLAGRPDPAGPRCALSGIHTALCHARRPRVFVTACDMPFVSVAMVRRLARRRGRVVVPVGPDGPQPLHALWDRSCRAALARRLKAGRLSVREALVALGAVRVRVRARLPFLNVNTPRDWAQLSRRRPVRPGGGRRKPLVGSCRG